MKKVLHFLPSILIFAILAVLMFVLCGARGDPFITPWDVVANSLEFLFKGFFRLGLPLFLAADWLLLCGKWYGGLLPAPMCAYLLYDYYAGVGPRIVDARIIAMIVAGCYLLRIAAVFIVRAVKAKKRINRKTALRMCLHTEGRFVSCRFCGFGAFAKTAQAAAPGK